MPVVEGGSQLLKSSWTPPCCQHFSTHAKLKVPSLQIAVGTSPIPPQPNAKIRPMATTMKAIQAPRTGPLSLALAHHNDDVFVSIEPGSLTPRQMYDLLVGVIQPRPIAFVSTMSSGGQENLAPFSFFMAGGANPPSLMYSPSLNAKGEPKDSLRNVEETGEFVVNIVTRTLADAMNATSFDYPASFSEWVVSGLTPMESEVVRPRRVMES